MEKKLRDQLGKIGEKHNLKEGRQQAVDIAREVLLALYDDTEENTPDRREELQILSYARLLTNVAV